MRELHTLDVQVCTDLTPDKVPPATIARIRTCPIPEQPLTHFTDTTAEGCQVSNYQHHNNIFSSQINKWLHILCPFLKMAGKQKFAWTDDNIPIN